MPGHVKKSTGPDPDPSEFLYISLEMKRKDQTKPYDAKKSCWVPDENASLVAQLRNLSRFVANSGVLGLKYTVQRVEVYLGSLLKA